MRTHERLLINMFFPARFGQDNVVKFLLQAKADVNARNIEARRLFLLQWQLRYTILMHALPLMLTIMLLQGRTPLSQAVENNRLPTSLILQQHGAVGDDTRGSGF